MWGAGDYPLVTGHMHRVHAYQHRAVLPALVLVPHVLPLAAALRPEFACHRCPIPFDGVPAPIVGLPRQPHLLKAAEVLPRSSCRAGNGGRNFRQGALPGE